MAEARYEAQVRAAVWEAPSRDYPSGSPQIMGTLVREIHGQVRREIFIDTGAIVNGDGYQQTPYDNITDAIDDAEANGITRLVFLADATLDRQVKNFHIVGIGQPALDLNGQNVDGSEFELIRLDGSYTGSIVAKLCNLSNNLSGLNGKFFGCGLGGLITLAPGAVVRLVDAYSEIPGVGTPELSMLPAFSPQIPHKLDIRNYSGGLTISNSQHPDCESTIEMSQGRVFLAASNVAGTSSIRGVAFLQDLSTGTYTVETSGLIQPANVVDTLTLVGTLLKFQGNRTVLDKAAFTLTIYDTDRVTPIRVFDLREFGVGPSISTITERLPVSGSPLTP
ncbi:hypothetical protein LCGC14_2679050 [marine sediment metagenome]|uniref:Uncharacterized protein n=1 Tax=marine sediment metagenome TaxID=412755 RepID=A0A0F9A9H2_9ZZZZ